MTVLPAGTFYRWMRRTGRLGDQHKVPRATNDRAVATALLAAGGAGLRPVASLDAPRRASVI